MIFGQSSAGENASHRRLQGRCVLLAEDCIDHGRLLLHYLKKAGADVILECNGHSAVNAVKKSPDEFDAIVMDFEMPQMDGIFATESLRALGYSGVIIAATAHHSEELREAWFVAGCDAYLVKPLEESRLIQAIGEHLRSRLLQPQS